MALVLAKSGLWLFLIGLVIGGAIPRFTSPRLALSAHLTAVQSGTALLAIGGVWPELTKGIAYAELLGHALWVAVWMLCAGLTLAAIWGANRVLPIAGAGHGTTILRERVTAVVILAASGSLLVVFLALSVMGSTAEG